MCALISTSLRCTASVINDMIMLKLLFLQIEPPQWKSYDSLQEVHSRQPAARSTPLDPWASGCSVMQLGAAIQGDRSAPHSTQ